MNAFYFHKEVVKIQRSHIILGTSNFSFSSIYVIIIPTSLMRCRWVVKVTVVWARYFLI